ncbi:MAG: ABC transporter substrate-binding protein [Alphaproteobacteria bacterium]|nr:ABC transporter substrate-binding protein [Alphaproteobacteria bacterium]
MQTGSAMGFVKDLSSTVLNQLTGTDISDSERVKRLRKLLVNHFDVPVVGKFVLGVYWRRTSKQQFDQFLKLYEIYVAHNYAGLFKKYHGETIDILREQPGGDDTTQVFGRINQVSGPPIALEMRVHKKDGTFKALDLKIEGVSMPLTHRKQFASVIGRSSNGVQGLIDALEKATSRFEAETPSQ